MSKYLKVLNNKKGVAGLDVLLAVITFLFMIGLLIMILALVGGELKATTTVAADATALSVINTTTNSLASTVDWFDIIIVLAAVVVLILLTVIIIRAIRGSGMMGAGGGA